MAETKVATGSNLSPPREVPSSLVIRTELKETTFDRVLMVLSSVISCLVIIFVITQVLVRFVTVHVGFSLPWTEEVSRYLLIWFVFFGSAVAWRNKEHITITSLVDYFPAKVKFVLDFVSCTLILFFLVIAITGSLQLTLKLINSPVGAIPWLRYGHVYGIMTLGLVLIGFYMLRWLIYYITEMPRLLFKKGQVSS